MTADDLLVHITTLPDWFDALRIGRLEPPSLASAGFVHLSPPRAVHLPANRLYRDEADPWLLVIDPVALRSPVRWEPADPPGDNPLDFPHLYGPLDLDAVHAVVPYPHSADGGFSLPERLPRRADLPARARAMEWYLARARAAVRTELAAGVSVRHPEYSVSYEHNRVILHRPLPLADVELLCARELDGLAHWQVCVDGPVDATAIRSFGAAGWSYVENLLMVATPPLLPPRIEVRVETVGRDELTAARTAMWRRDMPGVSDETVRQLVEREQLSEDVTDLHHLAVRDANAIVAQADLYVLGATAQIDWVETEPEHRGRGYATAIVLTAVELGRQCAATSCSCERMRMTGRGVCTSGSALRPSGPRTFLIATIPARTQRNPPTTCGSRLVYAVGAHHSPR